jgi:hypothetical protein
MKKILKSGVIFGAILFCLFLLVQSAHATTPKTITGQVLKDDSTPVTNGTIVPTRIDSENMEGVNSVDTDASGNYTLSLPAADWALTVRPQAFATDWSYFGSPKIVVFNHNESTEVKTQDFTVTKTNGAVIGILAYSNGDSAANAQVSAVNSEGKGTTVQAGPDGSFSIPVVGDTYSIEIGWHSEMTTQAFPRQNVTVASGETKNLGTIAASLMDSQIIGTVSGVSLGFGEGMTVRAWQKDGNVVLNTDTDANKSFDFAVSPGTWFLGPGGGGQSHHFFMRSPIEVTIDSHGQTVNIDFPYVAGDYFVAGDIKDEDGNLIDLTSKGTIYVRDEKGQTFTNFIEGSHFQIIYPSSYMTENIKAGLELLPNFSINGVGYSFKEEKDLVMRTAHGDTDLVVKKDEEIISGQMRDSNGAAITNMPVQVRVVAADSNGNVKTADVKTNGSYSLAVADGVWQLGFKVLDEDLNYYISFSQEVEVADKAAATQDATLNQTDTTISGQVLDKDGNPVVRVAVLAESEDLKFKTQTNDSGNFTVNVKSGLNYSLTMGVPSSLSGNLSSIVNALAGSSGVILRMQAADVAISGKLYLGENAVSSGYVKAWTNDGANAQSEVASDGSYSLPVAAGKKWYIAGASVDGNKAYVTEIIGYKPEAAVNTLNLSLGENYYNFPSTTVEKFFANESRVFALADGTVIQLPANATGTGNAQRTLMAIPTIDLAAQTNSKTLPIGYNFEIRDENNIKISNFNQPISVIFAWNPNIADEMGADTESLEPKYWDNGNSVWRDMGMNIKNTANNTTVVVTDHFTSFGLSTASLGGAKRARNYIIATPQKDDLAFVKIYNHRGKKISQFEVFKKNKKEGSFKSITADFNGDTVSEILVYPGSGSKTGMALLTKNGTKIHKKALYPFGKFYNKEYVATAADFNADGKQELIVSNFGRNSKVKIYKYGTKKFSLWKTLKPYGKLGENINVISADITKKYPSKELVVSAKNQAQVKAYYFKGGKFKLLKSVKPYGKKLTGSLNLAAGDVNADGREELVISPKEGTSGAVKIYKYGAKKFSLIKKFFPYGKSSSFGVNVNLADVNANGRADLITNPEVGDIVQIKVYQIIGAKKVKLIKSFLPFKTGLVNVAAADLNRDTKAEIVVSQKNGATVKIYRYKSSKFSVLEKFKPYEKSYSKGINVSLLSY